MERGEGEALARAIDEIIRARLCARVRRISSFSTFEQCAREKSEGREEKRYSDFQKVVTIQLQRDEERTRSFSIIDARSVRRPHKPPIYPSPPQNPNRKRRARLISPPPNSTLRHNPILRHIHPLQAFSSRDL